MEYVKKILSGLYHGTIAWFRRKGPNLSILWEACVETTYTIVAATLPIWFIPIISIFIFNTEVGPLEHIFLYVSSGELFLYSAALIGPMLYMITANYGSLEKNSDLPLIRKWVVEFPKGKTLIGVISLTILVCGFAFPLLKLSDIGIIEANLNMSGIMNASIFVFLFTIFCFVVVAYYRISLMNPVEINRSQEDAFALEWRDVR